MGRWAFNYTFKFFLEYFDFSYIHIQSLFKNCYIKYDNSPLLKHVRIILLTIVIFWGTLVFINKFFSKRNRNFKHYQLCRIHNKHPFITILKRFLFGLFFLSLLRKANNIKTNFEVLKCQDSKKIFSKDSYLTMQAIGKTETKEIYPTMLYQRFIYASISLILDSYFSFQVKLI